MNADEFAAVALALGLSNPAYADALGVDVRRVRAYVSGGRPIPKVVGFAARALSIQPRVADARRLLAG